MFIHVCKVDSNCAASGWMCEARAQSKERYLLSLFVVLDGKFVFVDEKLLHQFETNCDS